MRDLDSEVLLALYSLNVLTPVWETLIVMVILAYSAFSFIIDSVYAHTELSLVVSQLLSHRSRTFQVQILNLSRLMHWTILSSLDTDMVCRVGNHYLLVPTKQPFKLGYNHFDPFYCLHPKFSLSILFFSFIHGFWKVEVIKKLLLRRSVTFGHPSSNVFY